MYEYLIYFQNHIHVVHQHSVLVEPITNTYAGRSFVTHNLFCQTHLHI